MCNLCPVIDDELMLAEIDRELMLAEADAGVSVPGATRALTEPERRAKVKFGEIDKLERDAEAEALALIVSLQALFEREITAALFGTADAIAPAQLSAGLTALLATQPPTVAHAVGNLKAQIGTILSRVYEGSSAIVLDEARRQGVDVSDLKPKLAPAAPDVALADGGFFDALAGAVASSFWQRVTGVLQAQFLTPATLLGGAVERATVAKAIADVEPAGAVDQATQAIHSARGAGRYDTADELEPSDVWASELLDGATCDPCAKVDQKKYATLAEARVEYETGGYGACKGGARCRGTLVMIYGGTSPKLPPEPPTLPVLPDAPTPPPAPAPKTPRAPRRPKAAPAVPAPAPATPKPAEPGLPPAPTAAPPKRRKGTSQRYDAINQLPIKASNPAPKSAADLFAEAKLINPARVLDINNKTYSNNCTSVVNAYEFRRRGYDVNAAPVKGGKGRFEDEYIETWWKDADGNPPKLERMGGLGLPPTRKQFYDATDVNRKPGGKIVEGGSDNAKVRLDEWIEDQPEGARGFIQLYWAKSGGHVFSWEKIDGKPVYIEAQTGNSNAAGHLASGKFQPRSLKVVRIDDKMPATDAIADAFESRPPELATELDEAAKKKAAAGPTTAQKKKMSYAYTRQKPDGTSELIPPFWRMNKATGRYEEVPQDERQKLIDEWDARQAERLAARKAMGR
ncbi:capsid maturation protease [Arthrobacter phage Abba]|uniref:Capsid maturation protease n=1 Tax=Arthrobacter phage Abba TaxID=2713256 RepID=A0A6G8R2D5_9CAUD|nr:head maturation protease [Arthrobacter phage Abba]QIN94333.1 capsid maturation protease [Arthrobacter phage Abba]